MKNYNLFHQSVSVRNILPMFLFGIFKYMPGYKSHDLLLIGVVSLLDFFVLKYPLHDLLSSVNAVVSTKPPL